MRERGRYSRLESKTHHWHPIHCFGAQHAPTYPNSGASTIFDFIISSAQIGERLDRQRNVLIRDIPLRYASKQINFLRGTADSKKSIPGDDHRRSQHCTVLRWWKKSYWLREPLGCRQMYLSCILINAIAVMIYELLPLWQSSSDDTSFFPASVCVYSSACIYIL